MPSVHDVARRAGVSPSTVSRVLSGSPYPIRDETRERVMAAARELDFRPNMLARALVTARTRTFGCVVHDISDPYFGEIVRGLEDAARDQGYTVFVCSSDRDPDRELEYVRALLSYQVDALIFAGGGIQDPEHRLRLGGVLDAFRGQGGRVVLLAPHWYRAPSVVPDNRGGARAMTAHLVALGHRRIAFISGPEHLETSDVRLDGHREGLEGAGIPFDEGLVISGGFTADGGERAAGELLSRRPDLTAIFAANDMMAFGALRALSGASVQVPDDVSVAGFDDVQMAAYVRRPLTTVRVPMYELGREGAGMALRLLARGRPRSAVLLTEIVERESTAPPRRRR